MKPKELTMPEIENMEEMTPAELNNIRFSSKHTVLSPQLLSDMSTDDSEKSEK